MSPDKAPVQPDAPKYDALNDPYIDFNSERTPIFDDLVLEWETNLFDERDTIGETELIYTTMPAVLASDGLAKVIAAQVKADFANPKYGVPLGRVA